MLTSSQFRAARALLGLSQKEVAARAFKSISLVRNYESGLNEPHANSEGALRKVYEEAGVSFDLSKGKGPGVRLLK